MDVIRAYNRSREFVVGLISGDALKAKTMRGGAWLGMGSVTEQAVRFARNMLLARLLAPGAFGTMAIVFSSASLLQTLTDVGVGVAIIQNPRGDEKAYLNASWWLGMGRAIFTYFLIFATAPFISEFYRRPELSALLRVTLVGVLFTGATSPRYAFAQRKMKFGRIVAITNGGGICGVIVTVVLSFFMRDVWALAFGYCSENIFRFLLSYALCPGLPSLGWDRRVIRELLTFSRGIFGLTLMILITTRADVFVLGKLYSSAALGLYTMAVALVLTPSIFFTNMLGQALLPALSSVQEDTVRLNRILLTVTSWLLMLGMPAAVFVSLSAPSLLRIAYGARYAAAAGPLSVASAVVFVTVLNSSTTCFLFAKGRPAVHRRAVFVTAVVMLIAVYPAAKFLGPVGGQIAALAAGVTGFLYQLILLRSVTGLSLLQYASAFVTPALGSAAMLAIVLAARGLGLTARPATDMALCATSCLVAYAICASAKLRASRRRISSQGEAKMPESSIAL